MTREEIDKALLRLQVRAKFERRAFVPEATDAMTIAFNRYRHNDALREMGIPWPTK